MNTIKTIKSGFGGRLLGLSLLASTWPASATPPPPPKAPLLRHARMTATIRLIEAKHGNVFNSTELCRVGGNIPVYADNGRPLSFPAERLFGCTLARNGATLDVTVWGVKADSKSAGAYASAGVSVTPPGAVPACDHPLCGPQPLADSRAEIRVSGRPKTMAFSLSPNPTSVLRARPSVWLEADVVISD